MSGWDFPGGQEVKAELPLQEAQVRFPCQEVPLEKEMATHSCVLAWEIPQIEEVGGLQFMGTKSWT